MVTALLAHPTRTLPNVSTPIPPPRDPSLRGFACRAQGCQAVVAPAPVLGVAAAITRSVITSNCCSWAGAWPAPMSHGMIASARAPATVATLGILLAPGGCRRARGGASALAMCSWAVLSYLGMTTRQSAPAQPWRAVAGVSGADASFSVLMRYGRTTVGRNFKAPFKDPYPNLVPYRRTVARHPRGPPGRTRGALRDLAPERACWPSSTRSTASRPTPARMDAEILAFQPIRTASQHGIADRKPSGAGRPGDDAIDTLLPLLQLSRKLSRTRAPRANDDQRRDGAPSPSPRPPSSWTRRPFRRRRGPGSRLRWPEATPRPRPPSPDQRVCVRAGTFGACGSATPCRVGPRRGSPWLRRAFNAPAAFYNPPRPSPLGDLSGISRTSGRRQIAR